MNSKEFHNLIKNINHTTLDINESLENLTQRYPYFHTAHFLYAKTLKHQKNIDYERVLEKTAILTYDRRLLMTLIEKKIKKSLIKKNITKKLKELNYNLIIEENKKEIDKELTFFEWIALSNKSIEVNLSSIGEKNDNWALVDSFIKNKSNIRNTKKNEKKAEEDLSLNNYYSDNELMTETLAKIFVKQEKYDKAIQAYKILGLKYPEKNSLFAIQVNKIKNLKKKNK
ncbi:MAG: hypothetical protein CMC79_05100 [Flavobacteriaceae bacterium]|nr:hypothetical protein [Flavobacteriaceae bacterium]|tara:strand:- start:1370 stop:2053 length:684 start_codon:yes stop_codon:yes gene_type:complete